MTNTNYMGGPSMVYTRAALAMLPYLDSSVCAGAKLEQLLSKKLLYFKYFLRFSPKFNTQHKEPIKSSHSYI